ncbi:MAG TPA: hypothetical protein PKY78_06600 [Candidatus Omnitrophota bacterium]|nr:hypothetical protein [Candidatus Omnitrophota bacterium]
MSSNRINRITERSLLEEIEMMKKGFSSSMADGSPVVSMPSSLEQTDIPAADEMRETVFFHEDIAESPEQTGDMGGCDAVPSDDRVLALRKELEKETNTRKMLEEEFQEYRMSLNKLVQENKTELAETKKQLAVANASRAEAENKLKIYRDGIEDMMQQKILQVEDKNRKLAKELDEQISAVEGYVKRCSELEHLAKDRLSKFELLEDRHNREISAHNVAKTELGRLLNEVNSYKERVTKLKEGLKDIVDSI